MEKNKGLVIQAKFLEEWKTPDNKVLYVHGVRIKRKEGEKFVVDAGKYYATIKDQKYFTEGLDVEYMIERNIEEPKKSKIKPITEEKSNSSYEKLGIDEYTKRKMIDAVSFSAGNAARMLEGKTVEEINTSFESVANTVYYWQIKKIENV